MIVARLGMEKVQSLPKETCLPEPMELCSAVAEARAAVPSVNWMPDEYRVLESRIESRIDEGIKFAISMTISSKLGRPAGSLVVHASARSLSSPDQSALAVTLLVGRSPHWATCTIKCLRVKC